MVTELHLNRSWYCLCGLSGIQWTNVASHIRTQWALFSDAPYTLTDHPISSTGEKIRCKDCPFEATSNANMTRHRQGKLPDYPCSSRKKTKGKNSRIAPSSPIDDDDAVSSSGFSGIVPLTAEEYARFLSLMRSAEEDASPTPPSRPATPGLGNPYPVIPRLPTPSPPPEAFLPIPEEYRLPPLINVNRHDLVAASVPSTSGSPCRRAHH